MNFNTAAPKISIIIPALNEAACITRTLEGLQKFRGAACEIILVDGGSGDATRRLARPLCDRVLRGEAGRARQMHQGALQARGNILLFLHADTIPPADTCILVRRALQNKAWGRFDVRLSGNNWMFRVIECCMNLRSRLSGIATGDQALFMRRRIYLESGGFPQIPLMEDIALSKILLQYSRPACLRARVLTSSRRWEENGVPRTVFLMWRLRLAYALGADPDALQRLYGGR